MTTGEGLIWFGAGLTLFLVGLFLLAVLVYVFGDTRRGGR